jgi:hypothetical protein
MESKQVRAPPRVPRSWLGAITRADGQRRPDAADRYAQAEASWQQRALSAEQPHVCGPPPPSMTAAGVPPEPVPMMAPFQPAGTCPRTEQTAMTSAWSMGAHSVLMPARRLSKKGVV